LIHVVWEFRVRAGMEREFERRYSSTGDWARLFAESEGYEGTTLVRDTRVWGRYLVTDTWRDAESLAAFKQAYGAEYDALDKECQALTEEEIDLGTFEALR
jgi:heme-degrading monooxygenase HmoA